MRYLGGKYRIADKLAPIITDHLEEIDSPVYWEPFLGAGWVAAALADRLSSIGLEARLYASDIEPNLMLLHSSVQAGLALPSTLSKEQWLALKHQKEPSALRAFAGYGCSFGGMFFKSYAKSDAKRNYAANAKHSIEAVSRKTKQFNFFTHDFNSKTPLESNSLTSAIYDGRAVIYCDPPYRNTSGYQMDFNHNAFYERCAILANQGNTLLVSEYLINDSRFKQIKEIQSKTDIRSSIGTDRVERLYKVCKNQ